MKRFSILAVLSFVVLLGAHADAQPGGGGWPWGCSTIELEVNSPDKCLDVINGEWCEGVILLAVLPAWIHYETTQVVETVTSTSAITIEAFCLFVEDCSLMPDPGVYTQEWITTIQACWSAGGSASVEAKTGLVSKLIAEVTANVEFNGEYTSCKTTEEQQAVTRLIWPCIDSEFWEEFTELSVTGTVTEYPGGIRITCDCDGSGPQEFEVLCDATGSASGNADNITSVRLFRNDFPCCVTPPGAEHPCCGCEANP